MKCMGHGCARRVGRSARDGGVWIMLHTGGRDATGVLRGERKVWLCDEHWTEYTTQDDATRAKLRGAWGEEQRT